MSQIETIIKNKFMKAYILAAGFFTLSLTAAIAQTNNYFAVQTKIENGTIEGNYDTKTGMQYWLCIPIVEFHRLR